MTHAVTAAARGTALAVTILLTGSLVADGAGAGRQSSASQRVVGTRARNSRQTAPIGDSA